MLKLAFGVTTAAFAAGLAAVFGSRDAAAQVLRLRSRRRLRV
jgi:hypothetical protein